MRFHAYGCAALISVVLGLAPIARAELKPITDSAMGEVTGQAFMQVENIPGAAHEFTRMTLNMDVETRVNIDDAQVGQIDGGTDYAAQHVAMGHIARADGEQFNGVTYNKDDVIPFEARQPYIELAEDSAGLAGFRMGFGQARGSVSSHTTSFSGDIGLKFEDNTGAQYDAVLMDSTGAATNKRASHIGISPGSCITGTNCAPLTDLRSVNVGGANDSFTDGFFIGFQREGMDWQTLNGASTISAGKGVFINLPTNMTLNLDDFVNGGVDRLRTHQVDMGTNLF
ncbi:hypothetical protein GCM10011533_08010 [Streptosporangium jomthongense]|uniref:Porin n=1 Tax=Marinobacter aromaticivorans TaxID=1494078 RepID=A0ABW2ISH6_9GAMM|nr:hypothetical protein [Marinobacter aromaticivorans]GGE57921.1 hypothetical protein GCM10011533_08010 [Streptosporangium jomthongense]